VIGWVDRVPRGARGVGWLGLVVGICAALIALPPFTVRTPVATVLLGLVALTVGIGSMIRGERKVGGYAVAGGILGLLLGYGATRSSVGHLESVVVWSALFGAVLRYATPLMFASIGGLFSERSGVVNIGLDGMMLMGAFFGIWGADKTDSWALGLLIGVLSGGMMALLHAFFAITLRADQIVGGTAVNFLSYGLTGYVFIDVYGQEGTPTDIPQIPNVNLDFLASPLGWLEDIPVLDRVFSTLGDVFSDLNLMIWLALLTVLVAWVVVFKTPIGLRIRSVGEHPRAADTVGINVYAVRYGAVTLSGMLAAAGGAYLSIGFVGSFTEQMTFGKGFIALAAVIFGNWRPFGAAAACLLFGFSSALAQRLPAYSESAGVPIDVLFTALPYVLTLIAVAGVIGRSIPPAASGRPYRKS
jgi:general nucleoside transport system permease protein